MATRRNSKSDLLRHKYLVNKTRGITQRTVPGLPTPGCGVTWLNILFTY